MSSAITDELRAALTALAEVEQALTRVRANGDVAALADLRGPARREPHHSRAQLGRRLAEVRAERGMKQRQVATAIGLEPTILSKIETGERGLDVRELIALAVTLDVETDSLLWPGLEAARLSAPLVAASEARGRIGRRIAELRSARGLSQQRLEVEAGLRQSFLSRVESGAQRLEVGQFVRVVQALDVDTGVLLLRDPERTHLPANVRQVRELLERLLTAAG